MSAEVVMLGVAEPAGHVRGRLHELLDRELAPDEEKAVRSHLAECALCAGEHERLSAALLATRALGPARAPEGFAARVMRRVRADRRASRRWAEPALKVPYEGGILVIVAAAAAAAIIGWSVAEKVRPIVVDQVGAVDR